MRFLWNAVEVIEKLEVEIRQTVSHFKYFQTVFVCH